MIGNQDQKVNMSGNLARLQENFRTAFESEIGNNLWGVGTIPEGVGYNAVVQEFIYEKAWDQSVVDLPDWIGQYAKRRSGTTDERAARAWQLLLESVYSRTRTDWGPLITTPRLQIFSNVEEDIRHVRKDIRITEENPFGQDFDPFKLYEASTVLLELADELKDVETYELIYALSFVVINDLTEGYVPGDVTELEAAGDPIAEAHRVRDEYRRFFERR